MSSEYILIVMTRQSNSLRTNTRSLVYVTLKARERAKKNVTAEHLCHSEDARQSP
jgi:hypothetical protein